ncbi:MAG: hypothetical protein KC457_12280 [Myxococcales bacterium]|nr:hypothetical protein [Myxococcales bacterium]
MVRPFPTGVLAILAVVLGVACLPPARIELPTGEPALQPPTGDDQAGSCRALVDVRQGDAAVVHELRWSRSGIERGRHQGWVAGEDDSFFALTPWRTQGAPSYMQAEKAEQAGEFRCSVEQLMIRPLPHGLAEPMLEARPSCSGTLDGDRYQLESSLDVLSILGAHLGARFHSEGLGPGPIAIDEYFTVDLHSYTQLQGDQWFGGAPSETMALIAERQALLDQGMEIEEIATDDLLACAVLDGPGTFERLTGFAIVPLPAGTPRLRASWSCCANEVARSCGFDDPLPSPKPELARYLPDNDGLFHGAGGCSLGLDGFVRVAGGEVVGEHELAVDTLVGVIFLEPDCEFELGWLDD